MHIDPLPCVAGSTYRNVSGTPVTRLRSSRFRPDFIFISVPSSALRNKESLEMA